MFEHLDEDDEIDDLFTDYHLNQQNIIENDEIDEIDEREVLDDIL